MTERRMDAYYYSFDSTGCDPVDKILSAVACAGKAYHHTDDWYEHASPQDDHTGGTPIDWIQNAAVEAAAEIERLREALTKIASESTSTPSKMFIDYARAAITLSHFR